MGVVGASVGVGAGVGAGVSPSLVISGASAPVCSVIVMTPMVVQSYAGELQSGQSDCVVS